MNISVNIDCTPEEARRFMGLPDLTPIHDLYLDRVRQSMVEGLSPDAIEGMVRAWMPMGEVGMSAWKAMVEQMKVPGQG